MKNVLLAVVLLVLPSSVFAGDLCRKHALQALEAIHSINGGDKGGLRNHDYTNDTGKEIKVVTAVDFTLEQHFKVELDEKTCQVYSVTAGNIYVDAPSCESLSSTACVARADCDFSPGSLANGRPDVCIEN